ncbi:MAG: TolC family protein [Bdellovibrionota bacterium]
MNPLALILLSSFAAWGATPKLNLEQTVLFAVERSPRLNTILRQTTISRYQRKNVFAAFLPTLDLNTTHGIRGNSPRTSDNPWTSDFSLDLTENLYNNGLNISQYRISRLKENQANEQYLLERDKLCRDVAQEFLKFSLAARTLEIQEAQQKSLRKQFDLIASGYRQGWKPQRDYLRFKAQVSRTEIEILNAQNALAKAKEHLLNVMAVDINGKTPVDFEPVEEKPFLTKIPESAPSLTDHRQYRIAQLQKEISRVEAEIVHRRLWPELNLTTGAAYKSGNYLGPDTTSFTSNDHVEWNALLGLKFNFLDWGTRSREAAIATEQALIQENETSGQLLDLREELNGLMLDLHQKQKTYELSQELLQLELKNLLNLTEDYRQGKVLYLDYIAGLESVSSARVSYYSSLYDLQQGSYSYLYHQGTLYEAFRNKK